MAHCRAFGFARRRVAALVGDDTTSGPKQAEELRDGLSRIGDANTARERNFASAAHAQAAAYIRNAPSSAAFSLLGTQRAARTPRSARTIEAFDKTDRR